MEVIDLKSFEWKVQIRQLKIEDYDALVEMQLLCRTGMIAAEISTRLFTLKMISNTLYKRPL